MKRLLKPRWWVLAGGIVLFFGYESSNGFGGHHNNAVLVIALALSFFAVAFWTYVKKKSPNP